jgi:hypothetical protein
MPHEYALPNKLHHGYCAILCCSRALCSHGECASLEQPGEKHEAGRRGHAGGQVPATAAAAAAAAETTRVRQHLELHPQVIQNDEVAGIVL